MAKSRFSACSRWYTALCVVGASACFTASVGAQQGQWVFGTPGDDYLPERISSLPGGGSVSCGNMVTTLHDAATNVVWMLSMPDFYPQAVIPTADGKLAVAGSYFDSNTTGLLLAKVDMTGVVDWMHVYPAYNIQRSCDLIELPDTDADGVADGFLIASEHLTNQGSRMPSLIRTKSDGNVVWMNMYDAPSLSTAMGEFVFIEADLDQDDGIPIFNIAGEMGVFPGNRDTLLARIAWDGSVMQARMIGFDNHYDYGRGLTKALEGGFLVTGYSKQPGEGGGTYLMRVNNDFTLNWYRSMYGFHGRKEIVQNSALDAHLVGGLGYPNPIGNMALVAINTGTQSYSWGMQYGGAEDDGASDFAVTPTGYDIYGATRSFDLMPPRDYYLVKTDFNGVSGCNESPLSLDVIPDFPLDVAVELQPIPLQEIAQNLPNPILVEYQERDICPDPKPCECVEPPDGMVAWWTLDELVGPIASDSVASNDGNHMGDAVPAPAMVEYGIKLDGAGDYVEVPPNPVLEVPAADPISGLGNFSIDAWIKIDSAASMSLGPIVDKRDWGGGPGYAFYVRNSRLHLELRDLVTGAWEYQSSQVLPMNTFVHVGVAVRRTPTFSVGFHVNGVQDVDPTAVTILGSLANPDAALWIGGMRYYPSPTTPEVFFEGIIDEVEIFDRELDTSEFLALYNAQECGKCKFDCHVQWDFPFCLNESSVTVDITVYNYSPNPSTIDLSFAPVNPPLCGNINGPTVFNVVSPGNPVLVPGNSSVVVQVSIDRPVGMTFLYAVGCYEVTLTNLDNGYTNWCRGSVQDRRDLCAEDPGGGGVVALTPAVDESLVIRVENTGLKQGFFQWNAVVYGPDMTSLSQNIGINGNPPGQSASGEQIVMPGESGDIEIRLLARDFEGLSRSDLVLSTVENGLAGESQLIPLTSVGLITTLEDSTCLGDLNHNGSVDGADLAMVLGSWGECIGCATDLNGDDIVDGVDLAILLGNWGPCGG